MRISDWSSDVCSSDLLDLLRPHVEATARIYDTLEADDDRVISRDPARVAERLGALGYPDPTEAAARIERWRAGTYPEIGRAHVCTPVTKATLVCCITMEKKTTDTRVMA